MTPAAPPSALFLDPVLGLFEARDRKHKRLRQGIDLLASFCEVAGLTAQLDALERLARWVMAPDRSLPLPSGVGTRDVGPGWRRFLVLLHILEAPGSVAHSFVATLAGISAQTSGLTMFAETGLPGDRGLLNETTDRLFRRILPTPRDEQDLSQLLLRLFPTPRESGWVEEMPPDLFERFVDLLNRSDDDDRWRPLRFSLIEALHVLGARVQALGLSESIRARCRSGPIRQSPFFRLPRNGDVLVDQMDAAQGLDAERNWRTAVDQCRYELKVVFGHLETTGVSVDVVYGVDVIERTLLRMEALVGVMVTGPGPQSSVAVHALLKVLARARLADRSLRDLFHTNTRLLARKIIERAGRTGEHYITTTRREYFQMLGSAGGGGFLTTGTAALKSIIAAQHYPLFVEGFSQGINFAISFLLMQALGFTLATKQPSMTAATLAGIIRDSSAATRDQDLVDYFARICRSQLAAAMGNVSVVAVTAVGLDFLWRFITGHPVFTPEKSQHVLESLHPGQSLTVLDACFTGFLLWLSSLAAGAAENFVVYRRLPQAIAEHRMGRVLGESRMQRISAHFTRNISGWAGNVCLGFLLGMSPVLFKFFGLPLDVRHVTLSTGTLAFAAAEQGFHAVREPRFLWAAGGIAIIFVCNLGVSFALALVVALRAREVPSRDRVRLFKTMVRSFLRSPAKFLFPPGAGDPKGTGSAPRSH